MPSRRTSLTTVCVRGRITPPRLRRRDVWDVRSRTVDCVTCEARLQRPQSRWMPREPSRFDGATSHMSRAAVTPLHYFSTHARSTSCVRPPRDAEARVAQGARAGVAELPAAQGVDARARAAHGVRGGALPQHRRMLAPRHGDIHDSRRRLHACVRVLRRLARASEQVSISPSRPAWPTQSQPWRFSML